MTTLRFGSTRCDYCKGTGLDPYVERDCPQCDQGWVPPKEHEPVARKTDPGTSWAAAHSVSPTTITKTRLRILQLLDERPMTDERLTHRIVDEEGLASPSGVRTRRSELVEDEMVEDAGVRDVGATNRKMIVWRITDHGRRVVRELS
jgi:hypothetical protein